MKDYTKMFYNTNIDISSFITGYKITKSGIEISYASKGIISKKIENKTALLENIKSIENDMKLQAQTIFRSLYHQCPKKLLCSIEANKQKVSKATRLPLSLGLGMLFHLFLCLISSSILYIDLLIIILFCSIGIKKATELKKMNEKLNAELELSKRITFIAKEEITNKAIEKDFDLALKGVSTKTKLIIKKNLKNNLPAITMNSISEISLDDINKILNNINTTQNNQHNINDNELKETKDKEVTLTKENNDTYKFIYNDNYKQDNNIIQPKQASTNNKEKTKTRKKDN